ncbi:MFS transporter [Ochrobactrum soli]|uniref:D-galactonate transporter n=2 Tax=Ochrobactrum TaxID=528 RepID=A0A2P9HF90_9HYPH|nr:MULTISPECIES: MFS transporter [Brucella]MCI0998836.1 MFS transporter [Ochrobactrum sp. C6C9]RRD26907.1 MFS transporter [Brucellaceae bacterium VT-16-1752]WHT43558.1 MFS transporter [Ochrobactrum sp. SSR]MDX4072994.1 MFS transporter [Brucella sp. NBRC 113783]NNU60549.1 MFS transporter [[Ochrobactrum] soli]
MNTSNKAPFGASRFRYFILFMCFIGIAINYLDRANMSVALPFIDSELGLNLTNTQKGLILGAFFWAYDGMMLFAGWITDKLGARKSFSLAAVWWSVFTAVTPLANSFWTFFTVRFFLGAGEAPAYPAATKAASRWFPRSERAFATAVIDSGSRVGTVLALPIVTSIIAFATWHYSFVILGAVGIVWAFFWYVTYRDPSEHPRANDLERQYIIQNGARTDDNDSAEAQKIRWADLFRYRTVWGMMLGFFCLNFVIYFFLTWFPTYLKTARGLNLAELGLYGMIPGLAAVVTAWIAGLLADRAIRNGANVTTVRKIVMVGGMLGGAAILPAALVESLYAALFFLAISYSSLAIAATAIWSLPADVAPSSRHVASIGGIQNFASNIAGIISPFLFGFLLDQFNGSYTPSFLMAAIMAVVGACSYAFIVGRAEPLPILPPRS